MKAVQKKSEGVDINLTLSYLQPQKAKLIKQENSATILFCGVCEHGE